MAADTSSQLKLGIKVNKCSKKYTDQKPTLVNIVKIWNAAINKLLFLALQHRNFCNVGVFMSPLKSCSLYLDLLWKGVHLLIQCGQVFRYFDISILNDPVIWSLTCSRDYKTLTLLKNEFSLYLKYVFVHITFTNKICQKAKPK